jgi:probable HAF family extracellular repeat protein
MTMTVSLAPAGEQRALTSLRSLLGAAACAAALLCGLAPPATALTLDFAPVQAEGAESVVSIAISNLNQIAITTQLGDDEFSSVAPGSDQARVFSFPTEFDSAEQQLNGINAAHNAVGFFNDAPMLMGGAPRSVGGDGGEDGFITGVTGLGIFPPMALVDPAATAHDTQAFGINDKGEVVGAFQALPDERFQGFIESSGVYTTLDVPGADETFAQGVNNKDDVVGYFIDGSNKTQGFLESNGAYATLSVPGAFATFAEGINDEGEVVGYFEDSSGKDHGFVESGGLFTTFDAPSSDAGTTRAFGINDAGNIVGLYDFNDPELGGTTVTNGFFATAAPESSTWAMLLLGFAGLGFAGLRASREVRPVRVRRHAQEASRGGSHREAPQ